MSDYRIERDSMGDVRVPAEALWRAQTQRAVENFPISGTRLEDEHLKALAQVKASGGMVQDDAYESGGTRGVSVRDPDGNTIVLVEHR